MPQPLERRALIANLVLEVSRVVRTDLFPEKKSSCELFLLGAALVAAAGKPRSASVLARQSWLSRTTTLRRLDALCKHGFAEKVGTKYRVASAVLPLDRAGYLIKLVHQTSEKLSHLSKLDTNRT